MANTNHSRFSSVSDFFNVAQAISLKRITDSALQHGQLQKATSSSLRFERLVQLVNSQFKEPMQRTFATQMSAVLWENGDRNIAIQMLKGISKSDPEVDENQFGLQVGTATVLATLVSRMSVCNCLS